MLKHEASIRVRTSASFAAPLFFFPPNPALPLVAFGGQEIAGPLENRGGHFRAVINIIH